MKSYSFDAIGTHWVIDLYTLRTEAEYEAISAQLLKRIEVFDQTYSRFRSDSFLTKIAQKAGIYRLPHDAWHMVKLYEKLYQLTDGKMTPLIASVLEEAGYDRTYTLTARELHKPPTWEESLVLRYDNLELKKPVLLDIGAIGKGYLIDIVGALLEDTGIQEYCIDAGGDILYKRQTDQRLSVGLEHPENPEQVIGVATILNQSIAASAGNRRKWREFHHIMNPHTLTPVTTIRAVWVVSETALIADALATALFFTEAEKLQKHFQFTYLKVFPDYTIEKSPDFPAELFYNGL